MCGIVSYIGNNGNFLTRILTGMTSIVYRAPDSSGVGWFGDELEPIRVRKSLGSVFSLIQVLLNQEAHPDQAGLLLGSLTSREEDLNLSDHQQNLLTWEGFPPAGCQINRKTGYPTFDDLIDKNLSPSVKVGPGWAGRPDPLPAFCINSIHELRELIRKLIVQYDISPLVTKALVRSALTRRLKDWNQDVRFVIEPADILEAFERLFDCVLWEGTIHLKNFYVDELLWVLLSEITITIPSEYDRDGIRCLFRLLDSSLLSRIPYNPELERKLQTKLQEIWPEAEKRGPIDWRTLYRVEKGVNIYGWAAATGLAYLQEKEFLPELNRGRSQKKSSVDSVTPGQTDPASLRHLVSPIISHGRWAMQSPVTVRNTHPFFDASRQRIIVLNGQFNGEVEAELHDFLVRIGFSFRSDNSSEYMSLLWGHYFDVLQYEQKRYRIIRAHNDTGLKDYCLGSPNIDNKTCHHLKNKSIPELDELAFIESARQLVRRGGQIAVSGISLQSPRRLYVASHNRPLFIARRIHDEDVMVVSDINAALGLFPQSLILEKNLELQEQNSLYLHEIGELQASKAKKRVIRACKEKYQKRKTAILEAFRIVVLPLEGEEVFARIGTSPEGSDVQRRIEVTDFAGNQLPEVGEFEAVLNPLQTQKDPFKSFYETHLNEIPERLKDILDMHLPEGEAPPQLGIKQRYLSRRFGPGFATLRRVVLVGMGSSYNVGLMAKSLFLKLFPHIEVVTIRPVEVDNISRTIDSEKDLIILLSWSGATADMVEFAGELSAHKTTMIGITEKPFSEMALIARKSGGVIPIFSGEEVTFSAVKSSVCLLFCLDILAVWLADGLGNNKEANEYLNKLVTLPDVLHHLLNDRAMDEFSKSLATKSTASRAVIVIDALSSTGTGREAAFKLEENSLSAIGKSLDYRDVLLAGLSKEWSENLILVNATNEVRLDEALDVMKRLYLADIPFAAVSYNHPYQAQIREYSRGLNLVLPKKNDALQPFVDLMFYYVLAHHFGRAQGLEVPGFPRNRTKAVTTTRSRPKDALSPAAELALMDKTGHLLETEPPPDLNRETAWEKDAAYGWEKNCYKEMRHLAAILTDKDPLTHLLQSNKGDINKQANAILDSLFEGGEIILVGLDRPARAATCNVASIWSRLGVGFVRVVDGLESLNHISDEAILLIIASRNPGIKTLNDLPDCIRGPALWIGPEPPQAAKQFFSDSLGCLVLGEDFQSIRSDLVYTTLHLIMSNAWKIKLHQKAPALERLLKSAGKVIQAVLENTTLKETIREAMDANRPYGTAFYIGPPSGVGIEWVDRFDKSASLTMESHLYGDSAHGPLATVDPNVGEKFVRIQDRKEMVTFYGEDRVSGWEKRYLQGKSMDTLLTKPVEGLGSRPEEPFSAQGHWYLPVLQPGYDSLRDNLIIIDAAGERFFDQALDELGIYGCRYARTLVISQEAFRKLIEKRGFYHYPVSHLLFLPTLQAEGKSQPIPDMLLPFAFNLVAAAVAAAVSKMNIKGKSYA